MAKSKPTPKPPRDEGIPLEQISITWTMDGISEPLTLSGAGLARVLAYLGKSRPGNPDAFGDPWSVARELDALAALQHDSADPMRMDSTTVLDGLACLTEELAAQLHGHVFGEDVLKRASVTIGAAKKAAVA
jgi:hypothetical protein